MAKTHTTRGRPRSFDRDQALARAMDLFWAHGYDGVTLEDLQKAMGNISPPSFYAAFGSKDALFCEAATLYQRTVGDRVGQALSASPVRAGFEGMLRTAIDTFLLNEAAPGCLVVLGAMQCTRTNKQAHEHLRSIRAKGPELIRRRLQRAIEEGELPLNLPIADIASFYSTFLHGLAIRASDGASRATLVATIEIAMSAWPALTAAPTEPTRKTARHSRAGRFKRS